MLLAIDAINRASLTDADTRQIDALDDDGPTTRASARKLMEVARQEEVRLLVFGHDATQRATLRHAPAYTASGGRRLPSPAYSGWL